MMKAKDPKVLPRGGKMNHKPPSIADDADRDDTVPSVTYQITSYGADFDVRGLVARLKEGEIEVPPFQRSFVWTLPEASRFIESLLLGLPVPGIFLAREESDTYKFLVLDGQQRLKSLAFFYGGVFNPKREDKTQRPFALVRVQPPYEGKKYSELEDKDRARLDNSIIHATIVKQESPPRDDTSLYHIFERLNSEGIRLAAQEIRCAIYHGRLMAEIRKLNEHPSWRKIFGKKNARLKDEELILRFLALFFEEKKYSRPMAEFLNKFSSRHRNDNDAFFREAHACFTSTIDSISTALGSRAFRKGPAMNAAIFDSVTVGVARRLESGEAINPSRMLNGYNKLLSEPEYVEATSRSTADEKFVTRRLRLATAAFKRV
jgi:hypothetical protein